MPEDVVFAIDISPDKGAIAIFRRAIELDPSLDLDPKADAQKLANRQ